MGNGAMGKALWTMGAPFEGPRIPSAPRLRGGFRESLDG
jgi:hypothetical protein